jgi:hypothetical protein
VTDTQLLQPPETIVADGITTHIACLPLRFAEFRAADSGRAVQHGVNGLIGPDRAGQ